MVVELIHSCQVIPHARVCGSPLQLVKGKLSQTDLMDSMIVSELNVKKSQPNEERQVTQQRERQPKDN